MSYTIAAVQNNQITLVFDGRRVNFPLPIHAGLYPTGLTLANLLDTYVANARAAASPIIGANEAELKALITPPTTVELDQFARIKRGMLLSVTDWTQSNDSPLEPAAKQAWATYRQALRDLTKQADYPMITWPIPPKIVTGPRGLELTDINGVPT